MQSVILLRRGRVLWGTAMAACLLSGFIVMMSKIPVRALKGNSPAESLRSAVVLPDSNPNPHSRTPVLGLPLSHVWLNPMASCRSALRLTRDRPTRG